MSVKRLLPGLDATLAGLRRLMPSAALAGDGPDADDGYRLLVENSADMVTRHARNGDVTFASPATAAATGLPVSEILGSGLARRVHVADRPAYMKALSDAFAGAAPVAAEVRLRHGDEDRFVAVEMRCTPVRGADGTVGSVVAVTRDVSDRRGLEAELRAARETAETANLAKTHFLAHMSHELRTPLNAIIGFSEVLERDMIGALDADRRREYARLIHTSGQHLLEVVNGILDMSKIECGLFGITVEPLAVAPLIDGCRTMMLGQASDRGVLLIEEVPADLPELVADRRALKQILINLLSNGIKFTDRGGSVRIAVDVVGSAMRFAVRDNGIGIPASDLPRLGAPFMQADAGYERRYEGTGLGLSMVKGLATLHGGEMRIESELGVGTTVTVTLPLAPASAATPPAFAFRQDKELKRVG